MKAYISPHPGEYQEDGRGSGGIWRVINAQGRWLPEYGIEIINNPDEADVVVIHASALLETDKPIVTCCHGLYWTGDFEWPDRYWQFNASVIEALRRAHKVIVPSQWVAQPIQRDMRIDPIVIPHGIDIEAFPPATEYGGYILWAKPRVDVVSDPDPMNELARRAPDLTFVSTFGRPAGNVQVTGPMPYERFQEVLSRAAVWLATTRETGDIGSREAMARGIPVVGWNWGATGELVEHMHTGYLAEPLDYDDLLYGLRYCLEHRVHIGDAARAWVAAHCQWKNQMVYYADVLRQAVENDQYDYDVTVVVPSYNYANYLPEALDSIAAQSLRGKARLQVVVVDDCSTDNTQEVLANYDRLPLDVVRHEHNMGLPAALNTGLAHARGRYVSSLDADNVYPPNALELMYGPLQDKPWLDVASGAIAVYSPDGKHRKETGWPFGRVDVEQQLHHYNQQPSSSMMRVRSVKRLGGWRRRQHKNEDGEFWCRAMSAGLRFEQVTQEPILVYRWHERNKSRLEGGEDDPAGPLSWNFHYPWKDSPSITPFACTQPPPRASWAVRSYAQPHICVAIACGPGHEMFVQDALDSVAGQSFAGIECVVCNDTGAPLDVAAMGHPWARVVDTPGRTGPAVARNTAIQASRAPLIVPLDADDLLYPNACLDMYRAWLDDPTRLVYCDCDLEDGLGKRQRYECGQFTVEHVMTEAIYQVTCLYPKQWWEAVGGYPTDQPYGMWEDWLLGVKMHLVGIGAQYLKGVPWGVYRRWTAGDVGSKNAIDNADFGTPEHRAKYRELLEWIGRKEEEMACGGCRKNATGTVVTRDNRAVRVPTGPDRTFVYVGPMSGGFTVNSMTTPGKKYHIEKNVPFTAPPGDAELRFAAMRGYFEEILPEPEEKNPIVAEAPSVPAIQVPKPQPPPVTARVPPVGVDDLDRLELDEKVVEILRGTDFTCVADLGADIHSAAQGEGIREIKGIGPKRYEKIKAAVLALEAT